MTDENIQNLLGGFATGTLTDDERNLLFTAALKDQELFNALADEDVLREFLSDPAARRRLLHLLQPDAPRVFWMRRPLSWMIAAGVMAALVVAVAIRNSRPSEVKMAMAPPPAIAPAPELRDAPQKMKVAVLEFDSGQAQAKESKSKSADLGKTASVLLEKKLDLDGYAVIDRKQVVKQMQAQKLNERQLNPADAASLGRSLGADAVIMGTVKPSVVMNLVDDARQEAVEVTATAIDPQNAVSLAHVQGQQTAPAALAGAVDQLASSLGQQIQQNARIKIEGLVTDVNAKTLTLNVGAQAGVKVGDRLEIRRAGKPLGRVAITSVQDSFSVGQFEGPDPPKTGDTVANQ